MTWETSRTRHARAHSWTRAALALALIGGASCSSTPPKPLPGGLPPEYEQPRAYDGPLGGQPAPAQAPGDTDPGAAEPAPPGAAQPPGAPRPLPDPAKPGDPQALPPN